MKRSIFAIGTSVAVLWLSAAPASARAAHPGSAVSPAAIEATGRGARHESLVQELKALQRGLAVKEAELAKLRRKWTLSKGRTPTAEELKEFEKKREKGEVKQEDNPYINKSPLGSSGRWREAYFQKLAEIKKEKERALHLEQELGRLKP